MVLCVLSALRKPWTPLGIMPLHVLMEGNVVTRHNLLRDVVANLFRQAHMGVTVEVGYDLT